MLAAGARTHAMLADGIRLARCNWAPPAVQAKGHGDACCYQSDDQNDGQSGTEQLNQKASEPLTHQTCRLPQQPVRRQQRDCDQPETDQSTPGQRRVWLCASHECQCAQQHESEWDDECGTTEEAVQKIVEWLENEAFGR